MEHTLLSTTTITEQLEHIEESLFTAIFIGCHADDLEIGAGGTIARMVESGWNIWACILTAEADPAVAHRRQQEQIAASELLGLDPKKIFFMNFPDGNLQCSRETVTALRMALEERGCYPELVFTHTHADSHNDHRAAHDITRSTFRKKPILTYAVVNSLIHSDFKPKIFVDTTKYNEKKHISCSVYESQ
ncbi:MAG TPA: PIG-L deacetylase family protein, partial [Patescibacteria group bacterium]|nr:PIG-L deacetylase family protein [Patescibacteria group bacterium]